ncbi:YitT family protein [Fictibacillus iocasae]|uniref:YitT family protein n=1 Tax=Fictibacillus iocasae TaxID=2715437 RepID=A0ABW2NP71_9BACL
MNRTKQALIVFAGLLLTAIGTKLLTISSLTFGGTAGIATLLSFTFDVSWGLLFFMVNLPFFYLSIKRLGMLFSLSTLLCIILISFVSDALDVLHLPALPALAATVMAGLLIGVGVSLVLNNGSSLGGIHILAMYFEQFLKINRGLTLFLTDLAIVLSAAFIVGLANALYSVIAIAIASFLVGKLKSMKPANEDGITLKEQKTA